MALTQTQVSQLYVSLIGRASEGEGNTFWQAQDSMLDAATEMLTLDVVKNYFGTTLDSNQDFIEFIYENTLGKTIADDPDGIAFWVELLDGGTSKAQVVVDMIYAATDPANAGDAQDQFNNRVEVSNYTADSIENADPEDFDDFAAYLTSVDHTAASVTAAKALVFADSDANAPVAGDDFLLTADTDRMVGTVNDDFFDAPITQNPWAGGVSNSLSTADRIDGGAGTDTLHAELVPEFYGVTGGNEMDVQPRIKSVEDIQFEALDVIPEFNNGNIVVDAKNITDVVKIGSAYSDGDLVIENLTTREADSYEPTNTNNITVTMDHTDNFNSDNDASDLTVYFDEDYLTTGTEVQGSQLTINLINTLNNRLNADNGDSALSLIEGFEDFSFSVGDTEVDVVVDGAALSEVKGLIEAALTAAGIDTVTVTEYLEPAFFATNIYYEDTDTTYDAGDQAGPDYTAFRLTNSASEELTEGDFNLADGSRDGSLAYSQDDRPAEIDDLPISINVELDKVGRDGEGGNLVIGGKELDNDGGATGKGDGIDTFNIVVKGDEDRPSNLGVIMSTNGALDTVNIASEANTADDATFASLTVRGEGATSVNSTVAAGTAPFGGTLTTLDADDFYGDLTIGEDTAALNIDTFTAQGGGDVTLYADYLDLFGVNSDLKTAWSVTTGSGNDTLVLDIDGDTVDAKGESFAVSTGAGDDDITVDVDGFVSQGTMAELENLSIDSGAGNDEINLMDIGNWDVDAGSGDDTVYVANNGNNAIRPADDEVQTITFGAAGDVDTQGQVTVTLSNGQSFTTVGLITGNTPAAVAAAVLTAFNVAAAAANAATVTAVGAEALALAALNPALGTPGEAAAQTAYDAAVAATAAATAISTDYNAITAANVIGDEVTLEYGAAYSGGPDVPSATVAGILTDSAVAATVETTAGVDGTDAADATTDVLVIRSAGASTDTQTVTVTDGVGATDTITLADTDGNGVVSTVEFAAQMAAATYTDYVVTGSNATLGEVYLEAKVAQATVPVVGGTGDAAVAPTGTDNDGNIITTAAGTAATAFVAGVAAEVQTITVTNGADQAGTVTMGIDTDADGTVDPDEIFTFNLAAGNEGSVAAQLAAQINALAGVSAAQGAAGATIDDVIITWDLKTAVSDGGIADQAAAATTFVDGAVRSVSVAETLKGLEAASADAATWLVNYNGTDVVGNDDTSGMGAGATSLLYGAQLTVTYSGASRDGASGVIAGAAVATDNGFESTVDIETVGYVGNFTNINDAIMAAIMGDGVNGGASGANVLEELLSVREGNLESLIIESVIDGEFNEADLAITMQAADVEDMTNSQKSGIVAALQALDGDSEATYTDAQIQARLDDAVEAYTTSSALDNLAMADDGANLLAGSAGTTENDSTVELGTDDDVIVLSTHDDSNNTLVYEGFENGHDTVVNFTETGFAMDMIDFSSYLDAQTSASGSAVTAVDYAQTLNTNTTADLDEITVINDFAQYLGDLTITSDDETWAGLTADNLLAALNDDNTDVEDAWGNIQEADLDVANITDLVGGTYNHVVMVENDLNDGEYKVFNLVADNDGDFVDVSLIGVVDFGDTLANLADANFA